MKINKLVYAFLITFTLIAASVPIELSSMAKEQSIDVTRKLYEFGEKSEYEIDSAEKVAKSDITLGHLSIGHL